MLAKNTNVMTEEVRNCLNNWVIRKKMNDTNNYKFIDSLSE